MSQSGKDVETEHFRQRISKCKGRGVGMNLAKVRFRKVCVAVVGLQRERLEMG